MNRKNNLKSKTMNKIFFQNIAYSIFTLSLLCVVLGIFSFMIINENMEKIVDGEILSAAVAMSELVDGDYIENMKPGDENSPEFTKLMTNLRAVKNANGFQYVYILGDNDGNYYFKIDTDETITDFEIGAGYDPEEDVIYVSAAFEGKTIVTEEIYEDEFGKFKTGYAPIRNSAGKVIALMCCDYSAEILFEDVRSQLFNYILICFALMAVFTALIAFTTYIGFGGIKKIIGGSLSEIDSMSEDIGDDAENLTGLSNSLSENSKVSVMDINAISVVMEELESVSSVNSDRTANATEYFKAAKKEIDNSNQKISELRKSINDIKHSGEEISKVINLIDTIAKQTKILALNAEVEAVRAGEHGKSFAVVAKEVGELAQKSADAAKQTGEIIANNSTVTATATQESEKVNESLEETNLKIENLSRILNEVETSNREQKMSIHKLTSSLKKIEKSVRDTESYSEELQNCANILHSIINSLNGNIDKLQKVIK